MFSMKKMNLKKMKCPITIQLIPYGGGWTDVRINMFGTELYFVISNYVGNQFSDLMKVLYHMYPRQNDSENADDLIESKVGIAEWTGEKYEVLKVVDSTKDADGHATFIDIPWKAEFSWTDEERTTKWLLERKPNCDRNFYLSIKIEVENGWYDVPKEEYEFIVQYRDMCYAVAKACTDALKKHGFYGYHYSTYFQDINIRHLLFLKSVALDNFEARKLTFYEEKGQGEISDFEKEIELLLFDM